MVKNAKTFYSYSLLQKALIAFLCFVVGITLVSFDAPQAFAAESDQNTFTQEQGYEPYQGWQNVKWDQYNDPWYTGGTGGTSRKGHPGWSLTTPISVGVTSYDSGTMHLGTATDGVHIVTDTNKTNFDNEGVYADPHYFKNVILDPIDSTGDIEFVFNYVGAGGADVGSLLNPNATGGFMITKSDDPALWNDSEDPMKFVASSDVVWQATTSNVVVENTDSNWCKNIHITVPAGSLEAGQTYNLVVKNGTAARHARTFANIVFEFTTDMSAQRTWSGDLSKAGYGMEQGHGNMKFGIEEPHPSAMTTDLTQIANAWHNTVTKPLSMTEDNSVTFRVHTDGSGSNWQTLESWQLSNSIFLYDEDPFAEGAYNVSSLTPIASNNNGIACSNVVSDRDWPTFDGVNVTMSNLAQGKHYWLVFDENFATGNSYGALTKPIVIEFSITADFSALEAALPIAKDNLNSAVISADGKDLVAGTNWVTDEAHAAYAQAIADAEIIANNASASQEDIDGAVKALASATDTFNAAKKVAFIDDTLMKEALNIANTAKTDVQVSVDGTDLVAGTVWTTEEAMNAFNGAIATAEGFVSADGLTQNAIDAAVNELKAATDTFKAALNTASVDQVSLEEAIAAAKAYKETVAVSEDGKGVEAGALWAPEAAHAAFAAAIEDAEAAMNEEATQNSIDAAKEALAAAKVVFEKTCLVGVDTSALENAIADAQALAEQYPVSENGADIADGEQYVTSVDVDALNNAIEVAQSALNASALTQEDIDAAVEALEAAQGAFTDALKTAVVDRAALSDAISAAKKAMEGVEVTDDASGLSAGTKYVAPEAASELNDLIAENENLVQAEGLTQNDVTGAVEGLVEATNAFKGQVKVVPAPPTPDPEGGEGTDPEGGEGTNPEGGEGTNPDNGSNPEQGVTPDNGTGNGAQGDKPEQGGDVNNQTDDTDAHENPQMNQAGNNLPQTNDTPLALILGIMVCISGLVASVAFAAKKFN